MVGDFFNIIILLNVVRAYPIGVQFQIAGIVVIMIAVVSAFLIVEPKLNKKKIPRFKEPLLVERQNKKAVESMVAKLKRLSLQVIKDSTNNIVFPIAYLENFLYRSSQLMMNTFLTLWVQSFVSQGVL